VGSPFFSFFPTEEITTIRIPPALSIKPNRKRNKSFYLFSGGENRKISEKRLWRRDTGCGGEKGEARRPSQISSDRLLFFFFL
jgi:hypothetical protein